MAQIPIEEQRTRRGGGGWWKWLLGLLLVGLLVWLVASIVDTGPEDDMAAFDDEVEALEDETYQDEGPAAVPGEQQGQRPAGRITDLATLENGTSPQQMAGSEVQLTDLRVTRVLSDHAFIVEPATRGELQPGQTPSDEMRAEDAQPGHTRDDQQRVERRRMDQRALVLLDEDAATADVSEGQRIRVLSGSVRLPDAAMMQERDVQSQEARDDGYFILAERLDLAETS